MNYGLYLSATGVLTNSYRQDVIANNLANAETVGFKRDVAIFRQRLTEAMESRLDPRTWSNPLLEKIGGGTLIAPTGLDRSQGELESTGNPLDVGIQGDGYLAIRDGREIRLSRNGQMLVDRAGRIVQATTGLPVLDERMRPIVVDGSLPVSIADDGTIRQNDQPLAKLGLFDVPDPKLLRKHEGMSFTYPDVTKRAIAGTGNLRVGFVERSNVDPAKELTALMESQRQLEANANMIRLQDQMLARVVSEVGKIG